VKPADNHRPRKVCAVLVDRANYGRLKPVMHEIAAHPALSLQVVAAGTMVLERFGRPVEIVRRDGFKIDGEVYMELEGNTPITMAKSVGFGIVEFSNEYQRLRPDIVLVIGDRYEALAASIAAAYANLCLVHVQGGEISGSIDESARHAMTKFAQYHVPSTPLAAENLLRMGERPETILAVGPNRPADDFVVAEYRRRRRSDQQGDSGVSRRASPRLAAAGDESLAGRLPEGSGQQRLCDWQFQQLRP
jgi:UDP-hydrolysing UDP-N-acetyl-D-glucosamine 2-epimerase